MSTVRLEEAIRFLERMVPPPLAEEWDRSGLQVGDPDAPLERVLIALDPSRGAVDEAVKLKASLLLTHHPLLLHPLRTINFQTPQGSLLRTIVRHDIAVYSAHTNLDRADNGVNDFLAAKLGLKAVAPFMAGEPTLKVVVTVPIDCAESVIAAMTKAGGGSIGNYSGCAFISQGTGEFTPGVGTSPYIGREGVPEKTPEARVEMTVGASRLDGVRRAARAAHPYEQPVIDVYPMDVSSGHGSLGRLGTLGSPLPLSEFALNVSRLLDAGAARYVGDPSAIISRVAVVGGSGASFWRDAQRAGADLLLTGDVKYHDALDALESGFHIVDAGHFPTERSAVDSLRSLIENFAGERGAAVEISVYKGKDPFRLVQKT